VKGGVKKGKKLLGEEERRKEKLRSQGETSKTVGKACYPLRGCSCRKKRGTGKERGFSERGGCTGPGGRVLHFFSEGTKKSHEVRKFETEKSFERQG